LGFSSRPFRLYIEGYWITTAKWSVKEQFIVTYLFGGRRDHAIFFLCNSKPLTFMSQLQRFFYSGPVMHSFFFLISINALPSSEDNAIPTRIGINYFESPC
jgi:hypothetical protein